MEVSETKDFDISTLSSSENRSGSPIHDHLKLVLPADGSPESKSTKSSGECSTTDSGFGGDFESSSYALSKLLVELSRMTDEFVELSEDVSGSLDVIKRDILHEMSRHEDALYEFGEIRVLQGAISGEASDARRFNSQFFYKSGCLSVEGIITYIEEKVFHSPPDSMERKKRWEIGLGYQNGIKDLLRKYGVNSLDEVIICVASVLEKMSVVSPEQATIVQSLTDFYALIIDKKYLNRAECRFLSILCEYLDVDSAVGYFDKDLIFHFTGCWSDLDRPSNWPEIWLDFPEMALVDVPKREKKAVEIRLEELLNSSAHCSAEETFKEALLVVRCSLSQELDKMHVDLACKAHLLSKLKEGAQDVRERVAAARTRSMFVSGKLTVHDIIDQAFALYSGQESLSYGKVPATGDESVVLRKWNSLTKELSYWEVYLLGTRRRSGELPGIVHDLYVKSRKIDWISGGETWRDREKEKCALLIYPEISGGDMRAISVLTKICIDLGITYEVVDSV